MRAKQNISGLYAVTPDTPDTAGLLNHVAAAIAGGASLVQYRNKTAAHSLLEAQGSALLKLCRQHHVPLIINDHAALCHTLDADGVHIGADDGDLIATRQLLGPEKIIGVSCYNRMELAIRAEQSGADYVAFGSCFGSTTKPAAVHAPLDLFHVAKQHLVIPTVAIGGVTADNAAIAIAAGADAIAVISALWDTPDARLAAQHFSNLFKRPPS